MRPIAERRIARILASAKIDGFGLFGGKDQRFDAGFFMGTVAEGLFLGAPASAPGVPASFLDFDFVRSELCRNWIFSHVCFPVQKRA